MHTLKIHIPCVSQSRKILHVKYDVLLAKISSLENIISAIFNLRFRRRNDSWFILKIKWIFLRKADSLIFC